MIDYLQIIACNEKVIDIDDNSSDKSAMGSSK